MIQTKFWSDSYICELDIKEKMLFLYLLTNERVNLVGVYELSDRQICFDLGLTQEELTEIKTKFQKDGKFKFADGYIKIVNCEKYNSFTGEKNELAKSKELALISDTVLKKLDTLSIPHRYPMDSPNILSYNISINKSKNKVKNLDNILEKKCKTFIEVFNALRDTHYQVTPEVRNLYQKQNETYTDEQILEATRNIPKHRWLSTIDYSPVIFLRTNKDWIDQCLNIKEGGAQVFRANKS